MKEFIVETDLDLSCVAEFGAGGIGFKPHGELIRCKDCKHYDGYFCHNKWWGDGHGNYTPPIKIDDGFCDWAERREE